ncbi:MAG: pyruvate kinase [Planctomycetia bacterium]|nr:pyruvate kinase [Planctomycetia bacterium]
MAKLPVRLATIVATVGPATAEKPVIHAMLEAGVDVVRVNMAHGTHAFHAGVIANAREAAEEMGRFVAILMDLAGPKIRLSGLVQSPLALEAGQELTIHRRLPDDASPMDIATNYPGIIDDLAKGDPVLMGDGLIRLEVTDKSDACVGVRVVDGGEVTRGMGINLPGTAVATPTVTEKDLVDLQWGLAEEVDFVGVSFVRSPDDIRQVKQQIKKAKSLAQVVAKIEKPEAVANIDAIIAEADAVMVARGDLGVEMDVAQVPIIQKDIIHRGRRAGIPVIIATQMLQSMIERPQPTRAEVSDIAGAIFDGADAVMLSGETAIGRYPIQAIRMMHHAIDLAEDYAEAHPDLPEPPGRFEAPEAAIARGAGRIAIDLGARLVVALSHSGATALTLSKQRLGAPILAISNRKDTCRRMMLYRGVRPVHHPTLIEEAELLGTVEAIARQQNLVASGDTIVIISGSFPGRPGGTDMLRVHRISGKA